MSPHSNILKTSGISIKGTRSLICLFVKFYNAIYVEVLGYWLNIEVLLPINLVFAEILYEVKFILK